MTKTKKFKLIICIIVLLGFTIIFFTGCIGEKIVSRKATINDINIDTSEEIALSVNYKMIPYVDIDNLEITFKFYSKNNKLLSTKIKEVGNVIEGNQYTVSISLAEFSFLDIFKINYVRCSVTGGTVTYLQ